MTVEWTRTDYTVSVKSGFIVLRAANAENPGQCIFLEIPHEYAAKIAEAMLVGVATIEYDITQAVERMTKLD